jgi:hypothetical protein
MDLRPLLATSLQFSTREGSFAGSLADVADVNRTYISKLATSTIYVCLEIIGKFADVLDSDLFGNLSDR